MILPRLLSVLLPLMLAALPLWAEPVLPQFLDKVPAGELVAGADAYGPIKADPPVAPVLKGGQAWSPMALVGGILLARRPFGPGSGGRRLFFPPVPFPLLAGPFA